MEGISGHRNHWNEKPPARTNINHLTTCQRNEGGTDKRNVPFLIVSNLRYSLSLGYNLLI